MRVTRINDRFAVGDQPGSDDWAGIRSAGFGTVVNNRPDGEAPDQRPIAQERAAAEAAGLGFAHIPVGHGPIREEDVRALQAAVAGADGPVLAHCRIGVRSLALWAAGEVLDGRMSGAELDALEVRTRLSLEGVRRFVLTRASA